MKAIETQGELLEEEEETQEKKENTTLIVSTMEQFKAALVEFQQDRIQDLLKMSEQEMFISNILQSQTQAQILDDIEQLQKQNQQEKILDIYNTFSQIPQYIQKLILIEQKKKKLLQKLEYLKRKKAID
ncbi:hypothetical protein pb186bvf_006299 [Paramecium bursaria]